MLLCLHSRFLCLLFACAPLLTGCASVQAAEQNAQGPAGPPGLLYKGAYNPQTSYAATDVVYYQGASYVALIANTGVAPVGVSASTTDWGHLADQGATGSQGAQGPQGVAGTPGVAGPQGPQGVSGSATQSIWYGRKVAIFGDSYSMANFWQGSVLAYHGLKRVFQDAVAGRNAGQPFGCYAGSTPQTLVNTGACTPTNSGTPGNTLAQDLNSPDLIILEFGANDFLEPLGSINDTPGTASFYGYMKNDIETLQTLEPTARIVWITPPFIPDPARTTQIPGIVAAIKSLCAVYGVPVVDMFSTSGINKINWSSLGQIDLTHLTQSTYQTVYGPTISLNLNSITPLQ